MNKEKWDVYRIYKCRACEGIIGVTQKAWDDWLKECPFCEKEELILESADCGITTMMDLNKPKTIGSLAEKNTQRKIKNGESIEDPLRKKPFWRSSHKINYNILKNPKGYILDGKA